MTKKIYTMEELDSISLYNLRLMLRELGGTPGTKNISELKEEIISIQSGKVVPSHNKRGRKPKVAPTTAEESAQNTEVEREGDPIVYEQKVRPYIPFYQKTGEDVSYSAGQTYAPVSVTLCDTDVEPTNQIVVGNGILEVLQDGSGILHNYKYGVRSVDYFLDEKLVSFYSLMTGDKIVGYANKRLYDGRYFLYEVTEINDYQREFFVRNPHFDRKTPVYPTENLIQNDENSKTVRAIDLVAPLAKGQRCLVIAPDNSGKTTLLKEIAKSLVSEESKLHLTAILVDAKPEEVNDFSQALIRCELLNTTFDMQPHLQLRNIEMAFEHAKRLVECGKEVVVLIDSLTKLVKLYKAVISSSSENLVGVSPEYLAKKLFSNARNCEAGASLTIIATLSYNENDAFDNLVYSEFKDLATNKIYLSGELAENGVFPALEVAKCVTDKIELFNDEEKVKAIRSFRRGLSSNEKCTEILLEMLKQSKNNDEFIRKLPSWLKAILE